MPRTDTTADSYISNLERSFATQVYEGAALRSRGIVNHVEYNVCFPIFDQALSDNQQYGTLTDLQRDSIIDYLLK